MPPIPKKWRSVALEVVDKLQPGKKPRPLAQWRKELMAKGAKKEELDYMQVWDSPDVAMTHDELKQLMRENEFMPEETLRTVSKNFQNMSPEVRAAAQVDRLARAQNPEFRNLPLAEQRNLIGGLLQEHGVPEAQAAQHAAGLDMGVLLSRADQYYARGPSSKEAEYVQYTTAKEPRWPKATGEDYRELIITDPKSSERGTGDFAHRHWPDEHNPIAHLRMVDKPVFREEPMGFDMGALTESRVPRVTEDEQSIINEWRRGDLDTDDLRRHLRGAGLDDDDIDQIMLAPEERVELIRPDDGINQTMPQGWDRVEADPVAELAPDMTFEEFQQAINQRTLPRALQEQITERFQAIGQQNARPGAPRDARGNDITPYGEWLRSLHQNATRPAPLTADKLERAAGGVLEEPKGGMSFLEEGQSDLHQQAAGLRAKAKKHGIDVSGYGNSALEPVRAKVEESAKRVMELQRQQREISLASDARFATDEANRLRVARDMARERYESSAGAAEHRAEWKRTSDEYMNYVSPSADEENRILNELRDANKTFKELKHLENDVYLGGPYKAPWAEGKWPKKVLQRLASDAVERGNQQIGFTTGEVQRLRWPTEKQQGALYDKNFVESGNAFLKPYGSQFRQVSHEGVPSYVADVTPALQEAAKKGWEAFAVPGAAVGLGALAMGAPDESEAANPLRWRATPGAWRPKPGEARFPELPPPETVYEPLDTAGLMGGYERQMGQELREPRRGILSEQSAVEMADEPLDPKLNAGIGLLSATRARDFAQMEHQPPPEPVVDLDPARDLWNTGAGLLGTGLGMAVDAGKMMTDWDRFISGHSDPLEQLRGPLLAGEEYSEEPMFGGDWFTRQLGGDPESKAAMAGSLMTPFPVGTVGKVKKGGSLAERAVEAGLSKHETTTPARIVNRTRKDKGYSVNVPSGEIPTSGLMMGMYRNTDPRNVVVPTPAFGRADVVRHAETNKGVLSKPNRYLGTYESADKGNTYLDVSRRFKPEQIRPATKFGEKTDQISGYNLDTREEFPVGNWGNFVESPQFAQRVEEMGDKGRGYLAEHPADQWWDMHGSAFERVYGTERLPNVAGYVASTAPVSTPETNLQTASEYLRRHIKGEPIIQPDWRVGPGEMTRKEGKRIGMERGRAANLRKSERGALSELRGPKVREEAAALMGDPNAVVLDRHQIRLSEDPAQGVYAAGVADAISPQGYERLKSVFTRMAQTDKLGRNARDLSADVWTGIRETIKNTSALYGTKFKGSAVQGESKSYADIFDDLIAKKAKHMGLSVNEMESRLRSGDATLLSAILGTSVGWAAYQESQKSQREDGALTADATL